MSTKENQNQSNEEEIDLGKLFSLIGNMFSNLFRFIEKVLKGLFHFFILLLLFLKEHLLKLIIAIVIGASLGFALDFISPQEYTYDMLIEPNYNSIDQIYEKMEYYNVLIDSGDSIALSNQFNISFIDANSLVQFTLTAYETKKDQILAYDAFIKETDSLSQRYFSFDDFVGEGTSKYDSKQYMYRIVSKTASLKIFADSIIANIESNPTLKNKRRVKLNTLKLDSIAARIALREIDSLRSLYKKVTLLEVEKENIPNTSTYLDFSKSSDSNNNDIAFFNISKELNARLIQIESDKEESDEIVKVLTVFNPAGREVGAFYETNMFQLGRLFGGVLLLIILFKKLNDYLKEYSKKEL